MKQKLLTMIIAMCIAISCYAQISEKNQSFIDRLNVDITAANHTILADRVKLKEKFTNWYFGYHLTEQDRVWVSALAKEYRLKHFDLQKKEDWSELISRVDIVPPSLALAQAINESGWGRSRFAVEGNNYFGQHCLKKGCGMVPNGVTSSSFEVKIFATAYDSVYAYIRNLNTNPAYKEFRELRAHLRFQKRPIEGMEVVEGLTHYSQKGESYEEILERIMRAYGLQRYDE